MLEQPIESEVLTTEKSSELANQQGTLYWLSGFLDGEGTISFMVGPQKRNSQRLRATPYVQLCNTSDIAFNECTKILDRNNIPYYVARQKLNKNWKIVWKILVVGFNRTERILTLLCPYIITKREQCLLVLKYIRQRRNRKNFPFSEDDIQIIKRVKKLNQRGPSETFLLPTLLKSEDKVHT